MNINEFIQNIKQGHNYKLEVNKEQSQIIQTILQANDIKWGDGSTKIMLKDLPYLFIDGSDKDWDDIPSYSVSDDHDIFLDKKYDIINTKELLKSVNMWSEKQVTNAKKNLKLIFKNIDKG